MMNFIEAVEWMKESEFNVALFGKLNYRIEDRVIKFFNDYDETWSESGNSPLEMIGKWEKVEPKMKKVDFHTAMLYLSGSPAGATIERVDYKSLYKRSKLNGTGLVRKLFGETEWSESPNSYKVMSDAKFLIPHNDNENT